MYLIYLDESGNSGNNLNDPQQPLFLLAALVIDATRWSAIEKDLSAAIVSHFGNRLPGSFEVHGSSLRNGSGPFKGASLQDRALFRNAWLDIAHAHQARLIFRAIDKRRYADWLKATFGSGVVINPHIAAFALVAKVVNDYLKSLPGTPLGMFISDENREITVDVEKSIRLLRGLEGLLNLSQIVEKGFFIDSKKSLLLQLCDLCAMSLRKHEESRRGMSQLKFVDEGAYERLAPMLYRGDEAFADVMAWLTAEEKKKRPGTSS